MNADLELVPYQQITLGNTSMTSAVAPTFWVQPAELSVDVRNFQNASVQLMLDTMIPLGTTGGTFKFVLQESNDRQYFKDVSDASETFVLTDSNDPIVIDRIYMLTKFAKYIRASFSSTSFQGTFAVRVVVQLKT